MRFVVLIAFLFAALMTVGTSADAQTAKERREALKAREKAEKRIEADMVAMSSLVEALSKNMGQLHYLRTLCYGNGDQKWRDHAQQMMTIEAKGNETKQSTLTRAFNAGYYEEEARHAKCSKAVSVDAAAIAENGRHISTMLGDPYRER